MRSTGHGLFENGKQKLKMFFVIVFLTAPISSTSETFSTTLTKKDAQMISLENNKEKSYIPFGKVDFGLFGANRMSVLLQPTVEIQNIAKKILVHFDNPNNSPMQSYDSNSIINMLNYNISAPGGVHDVYISISSDLKPSDITTVQFHTGDFGPEQWYYLVVKESGKAVTACTASNKIYACTYTLQGWQSQKFKFEKNPQSDGYKIVTSFDNKVFSVQGGSMENQVEIVAVPYSNLPNQIWYAEKYDGGLRFRPKHFFKQCFDLSGAKHDEGAILVSHVCNGHKSQTFFFIKAI